MKSNHTNDKIFVGVDVSKDTLDVYRPDTKEVVQIDNSDEAIAQLCSQLEKKKRQVMVVMEGTGGYEYLLLKHCASHKLEAAVINPKRVRDFAKGIGLAPFRRSLTFAGCHSYRVSRRGACLTGVF